jgi:hypothetical protein
MSTGNIVRSKKTGKDRYTPISTLLIQNETLTADARIMLIYLLSLPADWIVRKGWLHKQMVGMSRRKFNDAFKLLVEKNYIHQYQQYKGNIKNGFNYVVYEEPTTDTPTTDTPTTDTPNFGEPAPVNRERSTTKYTETKYTNTNNTLENNNIETNTNSYDNNEFLENSLLSNKETNLGTNTHTREKDISNLFQPHQQKVEPENLYFNLTPELQKEADRQAALAFENLVNK